MEKYLLKIKTGGLIVFKKVSFLLSLLLVVVFSSLSVSSAEENDFKTKELKVEKVREYIENNVKELNEIFGSMEDQELNLEDVEEVIEGYYNINSAPVEIIKDENLSIDDIYPDEIDNGNKRIKESQTLNFEELITSVENNPTEKDSVYEFNNETGQVTVYIANTGEIMILDKTVVPTEEISQLDKVTPYATWKTTKTERNTASTFNAIGTKMFTMWAEGNFQYDGKSAKHANYDGDIQRFTSGSNLVLEKKAEGKTRTNVVDTYKYPEVYTRAYFESSFGIKWLGITMKSATVETYVGASHIGSLYGGARQI